jgi:hypothetical protein
MAAPSSDLELPARKITRRRCIRKKSKPASKLPLLQVNEMYPLAVQALQ